MEIVTDLFAALIRIFSLDYLLGFLNRIVRIPGSLLLILVNLLPIFGVLYFGWHTADIILLYWGENVIIGFFSYFKILRAQGEVGKDSAISVNGRPIAQLKNRQLAFFFVLHYGMFTLVHGIVIIFVLGHGISFTSNNLFTFNFAAFLVSFAALFLSHGLSYYFNFLRHKEYLLNSPQLYFGSPYVRIIVTHVTVVLGAVLSDYIGGQFIIVIFIILKICFDLGFHLKSHSPLPMSLSAG